jgi:hypothetical protein
VSGTPSLHFVTFLVWVPSEVSEEDKIYSGFMLVGFISIIVKTKQTVPRIDVYDRTRYLEQFYFVLADKCCGFKIWILTVVPTYSSHSILENGSVSSIM